MRGLVFFLIVMLTQTVSASWYHQPSVSSTFAYRTEKPHRYTEQSLSFDYKTEYDGDSLDFIFDGRWNYDAVYKNNDDIYSEQAKDQYQSRLVLNESFISGETDTFFWRLGYQKIAWGEADDLRVVDVINPLDLKDSILFDINDLRIPIPMLKLDYEFNNGDTLSWLTIFQQRSNEFPPAGAEFSSTSFPDGDEQEWGEFEWGLRYDTFPFGTNVSLYAFNGFQDNPTLDLSADNNLDYKRFSMAGFSLSSAVDAFVYRTELAYFNRFAVNRQDLSIDNSQQVKALIGVDYRYRDWTATLQLADRRFLNWQDDYLSNKHDQTYTASLERGFFSNRLYIRGALTYVDNISNATLSQIKATYKLNSKWLIKLNLDVVDGSSDNFIGQQSRQDRLWFRITHYL